MKRTVSDMLGRVCFDSQDASNERVQVHVALDDLPRAERNQFVRLTNAVGRREQHLGRVIGGPFFPAGQGATEANTAPAFALMTVEILGELRTGRLFATNTRPGPQSEVVELSGEEVRQLLTVSGDALLGALEGYPEVRIAVRSDAKAVLPRNVGIFGTVGSGKSNTCQALIEEAAGAGYAVIVVDVEGEYIEMDQPSAETDLHAALADFGLAPRGLDPFAVCYPASASSERTDATQFTLRTCDYQPAVLAEILEATPGEKGALLEVVDYFVQRDRRRSGLDEAEANRLLLDDSAAAQPPYNIGTLLDRASQRAPQGDSNLDYRGLSGKLTRLRHTSAFDNANLPALSPGSLIQPGHTTVLDVSTTTDLVKNLVTADLLRKVFAYKILNEGAPPTLLVIEEAHSFISRERAEEMGETLNMVRDIARRGRKRWLGLCFVTQQPGHLPDEFFELCNTRLVHNVKSIHNLSALTRTAGDVTQELWDRCPSLGPGQCLISCPQFRNPLLMNVRPAATKRKFVG